MKVNAGLLLHGKPITVQGVGKIHSPVLDDIFKSEESFCSYALIRAILGATGADLRKLITTMQLRGEYSDMSDLAFDEASKFCLIFHSQILRKFFADGLGLFCEDKIGLSLDPECFVLTTADKETGDEVITGVIDSANYKEVEEQLLATLNPSAESKSDLKFANKAAEKLWEEQNQMEEEHPEGDPADFTLTNIISKLSCGTTGYTLFDIYKLTVYQLLVIFEAYSQHRTAGIAERAYSHWGGDDFDPLAWMHHKE